MAAAVVAGNDHLADYASRYNDRVFVVPSTVSLREYQRTADAGGRPRPRRGLDGKPQLGARTCPLVREALQELRRRRAFRVLIIGVEHFEIPGVEVECRPWSAASEVRDLWDMDVGIMPLPDEPWARGKCGMKAIQYMGVGIPAVVSPVGANREIVEDGVTGFHAGHARAVGGDARSPARRPRPRARLGRAARESVRALYSAEAQAPRVAEILRQVAS